MITTENFKTVILSFDRAEIAQAMDGDNDNIAIWLNGYGQPNIADWGPEDEEDDVLSTGGFITSKDNLLQMCADVGIAPDFQSTGYYKASLGHQGGSLESYPGETKEDFESRCYRIALFALPGEINIVLK